MNEKLKRRLAGASVLVVLVLVVVALLPTPEQAARAPGHDVVTIPLHEIVASQPPASVATSPSTLAAVEPALPGDEGAEAPDSSSSGDDDDDAGAASKPQPAKPAPTVRAAPPKSPAPPPVSAAAVKPAPGGRWFVQIGGFADLDNARSVQSKLQSLGQPNVLAPIETPKGTIYRVRAGPYANRAAAQAAFARISAAGYPGSQLVAP